MNYLKCSNCHGTGRQIILDQAVICETCDGSGNACIDGEERAHRRKLAEIETLSGKDRPK